MDAIGAGLVNHALHPHPDAYAVNPESGEWGAPVAFSIVATSQPPLALAAPLSRGTFAVKSHVMKPKWMVTGVVALVVVALSGGGTVSARTKGDAGPYHGFGYDMEKVGDPNEWLDFSGQGSADSVPFVWPRGLFLVLDALLSLAADTLLLPTDALRSKSAEEVQPQACQSGRPDWIAPVRAPTPPGVRVRTGRFRLD